MALSISKDTFVLWLQENSQKIYWALIAALIPLALIFYFSSQNRKSTWENYLQAHFIYQKWAQNPAGEAESFQKLEKLLHRHPELCEKFGMHIAEKCITLNQGAMASHFAENALNQMKDKIPYHHLFAKTSIVIAEEKYEEALTDAVALKEKMEREGVDEKESLLFSFNLVRIASLEKILGLSQRELQSLHAIRGWLESKKCAPAAKNALLKVFTENNLTLVDYINYRTAQI